MGAPEHSPWQAPRDDLNDSSYQQRFSVWLTHASCCVHNPRRMVCSTARICMACMGQCHRNPLSELLSHPKRVLCWWRLTVHFTAALVGPPIHFPCLPPNLRHGLRAEVIELNQFQGLFLFLFFTPPADPNIAHA